MRAHQIDLFNVEAIILQASCIYIVFGTRINTQNLRRVRTVYERTSAHCCQVLIHELFLARKPDENFTVSSVLVF